MTPRSSMIVRHRQVVPPADLEVVRVVRRGHLDRAGAERRVDVVVGDDRDAPAGQRQLDLACRSGAGSARRRGARRRRCRRASSRPGWWRRRSTSSPSPYRIETSSPSSSVCSTSMSESAVQAARAPVDDPLGPVDQAVVEQPLEDRLDGAGQALVHREALARPVDAVAEPAHLAEDLAAVLGLPLPDPLDERLAAEVVPGQALARPAAARPRSGWRCRRGPCPAATAPRSPASAGAGSARPSACARARGRGAGSRSRSAAG